MAEVTPNSTSTQYPPLLRIQLDNTDPFKSAGSLAFRIDNFRAFSKRLAGKNSMRHCFATVSVRGLTFRLAVYPAWFVPKEATTRRSMCMWTIVKCENNASGCNVEGDGSWSCMASVTLRINSLLKSGTDEIYKHTHRFFSGKEESSLEWEDPDPWSFNYLLDPKSGLCNAKEDTVEVIVEISADTPVGIMELPKMDAIQVNEQVVFFNKNLLAVHSRYFHTMFYNAQYPEGQTGMYKVTIEAPATVEHFKRMLDTMYPVNRPLDDDCIEGVLHLANQFLVNTVEGKCLEFLRKESTKSALFKYRVADKYGFAALKDHVLDNLKNEDFDNKMFMANIADYNQLGPSAAEALKARFDKLFLPKSE